MVEITYQMVLSTIQTASLVIGIIYYITIMRNSQRNQELALKAQEQALETRQAQLFMELYNTWRAPEFRRNWYMIRHIWEWEDFDDFWEKYGPSDAELSAIRSSVLAFFEGIGVLVKRGLIDMNLVVDLLYTGIKETWEKYEEIIYGWRTKAGIPHIWKNYEYLYNELMKYVEEHPELKT